MQEEEEKEKVQSEESRVKLGSIKTRTQKGLSSKR